jgi:2-amino-4-hydroxy-6-hydroxymethyldihydropteridine diphosphokinase
VQPTICCCCGPPWEWLRLNWQSGGPRCRQRGLSSEWKWRRPWKPRGVRAAGATVKVPGQARKETARAAGVAAAAMTTWVPAYIGIGSNLGDSLSRVRGAFESLARLSGCRLVSRSRLYRTRPFGPVEQGDFINGVAGMLTTLSAAALLAGIRGIEAAAGRVRAEKWGPRTLDLDLLVFGNQRISTPELDVPHPGIAERGFVLAPLADVAPMMYVPGLGRTEDLLRALPEDGIAEVIAA